MSGEHDGVSGRALVVGGGIGGLAAALALCRAGWDVEVRERRTSPWDEGAGISLWPNALRALDALGVGDDVRAVGHANEAGGIRDRRGRWLARTDDAALARRHGDGILVLDRADLLRVLADGLPAGAVRTGAPVDGPDAGPGDLVVGADGISSSTRALVDPTARSRSTGTVAWRLSAVVDEPPRAGGETWGSAPTRASLPTGAAAFTCGRWCPPASLPRRISTPCAGVSPGGTPRSRSSSTASTRPPRWSPSCAGSRRCARSSRAPRAAGGSCCSATPPTP
ncbi:FAD-dependent monooxygenase [Actinomycetospora sp. CA-053990]|uniref:FAD-dependent monooxygenase n=1 Tax=Actinomycetospora sp. CA-053990 TaxID=3239891 RepID=UPI003D8BD870